MLRAPVAQCRMTLSEYLARTNTTPTAFARKLGVAHTTVIRWVSGETSPPLAQMGRIAQATGGAVQPNDFLEITL
jgi:DNA-binding transcriptional regulator YdaS (Cro superfamily)